MNIKKRNTKAQSIIWNYLLDRAGEKIHLSMVAKDTLVPVSTTHQILERQAEKKLVKKEKLGNLSLYFIDPSDPAIKLKKQLRTFLIVSPLIEELKDWSEKVILYGSAAFGDDTSESDIDLFVISNEKGQVYKKFSRFKDKDRVRLIVKNRLEWALMKDKDRFFYNEVKKGKVLWDKHE
jgi:predicted nucleotidyltransferase